MTKTVYFFSAILMVMGLSQAASARYPASESRSYASDSPIATDSINEITTFMTRGFLDSEKNCKNCSSGTDLDISGAYNYYLRQGFQVGGEGRLRLLSSEHSATGNSATLVDLAAVGTFNLDRDLKNSIFAKAGVGFFSVLDDSAPHTGYDEKLGVFVGVGKRFQLWNNVSYSPELRLIKKGDLDLGIEIGLINFSIFW